MTGQIQVSASGKHIALGSISSFAKIDEEYPRPIASFSYSYSMDSTETTQGAYEALMGRSPVVETRFGKGGSFPVYNVSFYDAALFCNARSKREGKDTVYSYTVRQQDATGRTYDLSSLVIHFEREGYRLPTEAEWEFAARGGASSTFPWGETLDSISASQTGWYSGNSGGQTHPVGSFTSNAFGLKDMLGNVMEWVNDWKGPYLAVPLRDFLGNRDPGLVAERVVKGGAFSYDMRYMRYSSRSANYPTLSSAAVEYVGFRCVLGRIPNGRYLSGGGAFAGMPPVTVYPGALQDLLGHNKAKLAFVNATPTRRTLCYADFTESPVTVHEFLDDSAVFAPVISPNGEWVAYGNTYEGDTSPGQIRIRRLRAGDTVRTLSLPTGACLPRWWTHPTAPDTALVYATSCRDNMEAAWGGETTYWVKVVGGAVSGLPELLSAGGYHDGLSGDGEWLVTGYRRMRLKHRADGSERILFTGPQNGKLAGDTSQVCNVSMRSLFPGQSEILLLDFGYLSQSAVVGRAYRQHEVLFRVDTNGNVLRWYGAPLGFMAWQDAEWSNHADFAVGLGEDQGGNYPAVVGLNLRDSTMAVLAEGTVLRQPGLWVKLGNIIQPDMDPGVRDSMGRYNDPPSDSYQMQYAAKMRVFWEFRDSVEVAFLGSSHTVQGIWPESFQNFEILNLGYAAGGISGQAEISHKYLLPLCPRLRALVFEITLGFFFEPGGEAIPLLWENKMMKTLGLNYDQNHDYWSRGVPSFLDSVVQERVSLMDFNDQGGLEMFGSGWTPDTPVWQHGSGPESQNAYVTENLAALRLLVRDVNESGKQVVLTMYPESPNYRNTPYYASHGPTWEIGRMLVAEIRALCDSLPNCKFYDAYQEGNHDYDSTMATDPGHLSNHGARQLSRRLDSLLFEAIGP